MEIAIIGGGITGLTTALALNKLGINCQVYEKTPQLKAVGAGIWMQANALKVLDWLGVGDDIRKAGMQLERVEITNQHLVPVRKIDPEITAHNGYKTISIHRARLQKVLYDTLPAGTVHLGKEYLNHKIENGKIIVRFKDTSVETDLLLAADGIHSEVRKQLFPQSATRYSGQTCWRGIAPMVLPDKFLATGKEAWGDQVRFGFANISPSEVYWFAVVKSLPNGIDDRPQLKSFLLDLFQPFNPLIKEIIESTPLDKIIRSDISDLKRLNTWHRDSVCLLGDAGHATTPNMGQGGCQGVEDAYYISQMLSRASDYQEAFSLFEKTRRKKVDYVVNNSWRFGKLAHSRMGQRFLKLIMKLLPEQAMIKQMDELYSIKDY